MKQQNTRAYAWLLVGLLWLIACLNYVDRLAIFSVLPVLRSEMRVTDFQIGLLGTVFLWTYGVCSPLGGYMGDRWVRRNVVTLSLVLFSAATIATSFATTGTMLMMLRCFLGVSEALYLPAASALIAGFHPPATRSKAIAIHLSGLSIGGIIGGTMAGYMAERYGWRSPFRLLGGLGWALAIVSWLVIREPATSPNLGVRDRRSLSQQLPAVLRSRTVLVTIFAGVCTSMAGWVLISWLPLHLYERFHLSMAEAGFQGTFYFMAFTAAGSLAGSVISDHWARHTPGARLRLQIMGLMIYAPALISASASGSIFALLACLSFAGLGRGLWDCNNMPVFCDVVEPGSWSTTYGVFNLANVMGGGLAMLIAGAFLSSMGLGGLLRIFAALLLISAALTWLSLARYFPREVRRNTQTTA